MTVTCQQCGKAFQAQRSTARYCSSSCRVYASQGVTPIGTPVAPPEESRLVRVTRDELAVYDRQDSPLGVAALELAATLSASATPASAKASLAKELRATLDAAIKGAAAPANPVDQLRERRDRKRASAS